MRTLGIVLTLLIVAACPPKGGNTPSKGSAQGSGSNGLPPAPPPLAAQGPTCESAIQSSIALSVAAVPEADRDTTKAQLEELKPKMVAACHEDKWSAQVLDCLDKARTDAAAGNCIDLLTPAQQDSAKKRMSGA